MTEQEEIDRDLDLFEIEREYERQKPKLSSVEWLHVFPEAKKRYGRGIKIGLIIQKIKAKFKIEDTKWMGSRKISEARKSGWPEWIIDDVKDYYKEKLNEAEKEVKATEGRMQFYDTIGRKEVPGKIRKVIITEMMIQRAKDSPIENLLEINRAGFTKCFSHNDKNPPQNAYAKRNFLHCFVCNKSWDTIAILMERDGYKFKEAVMRLQ